MSGSAVISVQDLTKSFDGDMAVDALTFDILPGSVVGLLGGNGAGKTTTLSMILGLLLPSSGRVTVLGEDMVRQPYRVLGRMNFSSPYVDLPRRLSARENLTVYANLYGLARIKDRINELAEELELGAFIDRPTGTLSAGQRTRVALAKALLNNPELLLLDEPTASLDPDTGDWVRGLLETWRARTGATVVLASHNMGEVERLCGRVLMMRAGQIVDDAAPQDLLAKYGRANLEDVFLDIARARRSGAEEGAAP